MYDTEIALKCLSQGGTLEGALRWIGPMCDTGVFLQAVSIDPGDGTGDGARAAWVSCVAVRVDILRNQNNALYAKLQQVMIDGVALRGESKIVAARVASNDKEIKHLQGQLLPFAPRVAGSHKLGAGSMIERMRAAAVPIAPSPTPAIPVVRSAFSG